ncbi:MAG: hypothetical protein OXT49_02385, partial [Gammaproteobacteria bacterium]|nr:hypothetical protein [Gammaproteobacteria bacterium]
YLERWARERFSPQAVWEQWQTKLPELPEKLWKLAQNLEQYDPQAAQAEQKAALEALLKQQQKTANQQKWMLAGSTALIVGALLQFAFGVSHHSYEIGIGLGAFAALCWYRGFK